MTENDLQLEEHSYSSAVIDISNESNEKYQFATNTNQKAISFHDIKFSVTVKQKKEKITKEILKGVNGLVTPGQLLAIMGPSGCGKTTLLDILAHRAPLTSGAILFNGVRMGAEQVRSLVGYVSQNDILMPSLTVRETLLFYADLKLSHSASKADREKRVDSLIHDLHLERCKNTMIGNEFLRGVSGGEKRRVSIAIELLNEPSVLFLDEPTGGLDSATSASIMNLILALAKAGRTVICTIHQPRSNIFSSFDQLLLMVDGSTIFYGDAGKAVTYFADAGFHCPTFTNPADYFIDIVTSYEEDNNDNKLVLTKRFLESTHQKQLLESLPVEHELEKSEKKQDKKNYKMRATPWQQFTALLGRNTINLRRDPLALRMQFVQLLAAALMMGLIFLRLDHSQSSTQSRTGIYAFIALGYCFGQIIGVATRFPSQKAIYLRDRSSGLYHTITYYGALIVSDFPFQLLLPFVHVTVIYWLANLNSSADRYFITIGFAILLFQVCLAAGIAISALAPDANVALAAGPLVAVLWVLFSGFFVNYSDLPVFFRWVPYISPAKYALEAFIKSEFSGASFSCKDSEKLSDGNCPISSGEQVLDRLNMDDVSYGMNGGILLVMLVVFHFLGVVFLKLKDRSRMKLK